MKKSLLSLILVGFLAFFGLNKANAQTVVAASTTGMAPVSPAILPSATAASLVIGGSTFTNTTGSSITLSYIDYKATTKLSTNFSALQLYVNTSGNTFSGATLVSGATFTVNTAADSWFSFSQAVPAGAAYTYFFVATFSTAPATNTNWTLTNLDFEDNNANYYYPGTTIARTYILPAAATASVTGVASSISATPGGGNTYSSATISTANTYTIFGLQIVGASGTLASKAITALNFNTSNASGNNYFYGTAYLFAGTAAGPTGSAIATLTTTASTALNFTGLTGQYLTAGTTSYYYVEIVYTGVTTTASTTLSLTNTTGVIGPTCTYGSLPGPAYTYNSISYVTATATSLTTTIGSAGLSASTNINAAGNYAVYGMSMVPGSGTASSLTGLTFTTSGAPAHTNDYFYATAYLYSSNNSSYDGTAVKISTINPVPTSNTLAFTGFTTAQTITAGTTKYYYVVIVYTAPGVAASATQTITYTSATTTSTVTPGSPVAGPSYTYSPVPSVTATNVPAADLTNTAIYVGQKNIVLSGLSLVTNVSTTPLTQVAFSYNVTAANLAKYFTGSTVHLVASYTAPTAPFSAIDTTAVPISSITATGGNIVFNITSTSVTNTTTYYYLVANYTVTGGATPFAVKFGVSGYVTGLGTVTTTVGTYPLNTFTCTTPTYYWTGAAGTAAWETPANWEIGTGGIYALTTGNGYYPGQIYAGNTSSTLDNVDISPAVSAPAITLSTSVTVSGITNENGVSTSLNIGSGYTLSPVTVTVGTTSGTSITAMNLTGAGTMTVSGTTNINLTSSLVSTAGILNLNGSVYLNGTGSSATTGSTLLINGGTVNTNNNYIYYYGGYDYINSAAGTLNINGSYVYLGYYYDNYSSTAAYTYNYLNTTGGTINANAASIYELGKLNYINLSAGTFNVNASSVVVLGYNGYANGQMNISSGATLNLTGVSGSETSTAIIIGYGGITASDALINSGGAINITSAELVPFDGPLTNTSGTITGSDAIIHPEVGGSFDSITNGGTINLSSNSQVNFYFQNSSMTNTGTVMLDHSSFSFGASSTTTPYGCTLNNTAGTFTLGPSSILNFYATSSTSAGRASTVNNSGTGTFTCSSTSMINFAQSYAIINQTSSNPFTLLSDASGSTQVGGLNLSPYTNDAMTGKYNVQRFISTASRNYRLLSSPVNETSATAVAGTGSPLTTGAPNIVDLSALGRTVTNPSSFPGAFIGGPAGTGGGFTAATPGPCLYLYQESIIPGSTYQSSYYSGKNVAITDLTSSISPNYNVTTVNTAAAGATVAANATNVQVPVGNGYLLYYIHDNTSPSVTNPLNATATTATGYINQGTIPVFLWNRQGYTFSSALTVNGATSTGAYSSYNMVGNPYPAAIDLNKVYTDNTSSIFTNGTYGYFNMLNPSNENYESYGYNGTFATTSGTNPSEYIASGQGFIVRVTNANKTLTFKEDQKTSVTGTAAVGPSPVLESYPVLANNAAQSNDELHLNNIVALANTKSSNAVVNKSLVSNENLSIEGNKSLGAPVINFVFKEKSTPIAPVNPPSNGNNSTTPSPLAGLHLKLEQDSINFDECGLYFIKDGLDKFNKSDAEDMDGIGGKVFLSSYTTDRMRTAINVMGGFASGKRVPLFVKFSTSGIFQLQLTDIANINTNAYSVFLIDNLKKDSLDMTLYKSYNFNYTTGTGNDSTRFVLAIEHKPVPQYALLAFDGQKVTQGVQLNWSVKNENNTTKFVLQKLITGNNYVFLDSLSSDSSGVYAYVDQHPTLGNNTYRLQQTDALGNISYSSAITIGYNSAAANGGMTIYPNPTKTMMTVTLNTSSITAQVKTIDIYNTSGVRVEHKTVNNNSFIYDASSYKFGVYIVELKNGKGDLLGKSKFVKVQ